MSQHAPDFEDAPSLDDIDVGPADAPSPNLVDLLRVIAPNGPWTVRTLFSLEEKPSPKIPRKLGFDVRPDNADNPDNGILGWVSAAEAGKNNCYIHAAIAKTAAAAKSKLAKEDIAGSLCTWTDVDPNPQRYEESRATILAAMMAEEPPFSAIIDSGNGYQGYKFIWLFTINGKDDIDKLEAANRAINESLNARLTNSGTVADSCHSIEHLMRAPGTTNFMTVKKRAKGYPEGDRPSRIVDWHPERIYDIEQLPKVVKPKLTAEPPPSDDASPSILSLSDDRLAAVAPDVMEIIRTGKLPPDMKAGHAHFKVVAELVRAGLSNANVKQVYRLSPLGGYADQSPRGFDGYLNKTIKAARDHSDPKLFEMNEKYCVMPIGGKTRVVTWGEDLRFPGRKTITSTSGFGDFKDLYDKYRISYETVGKKGKTETVVVGLGTWWISQPHRRQYDGGMKFVPQSDQEIIGNTMNLWRGFAVRDRKPDGGSGASGCQLLLDHGLKVICSGDEAHFDYLIKREAFIAQRRTKSEVAVALQTEEEGSGKGYWCRMLNRLYGNHAMHVQNPEHVIGKFNPHLETLLRLTADEALFVGDPRHRNALYYLITEPTITIEHKFAGKYEADNYLNLDIISNARHFIPVSGTARRFFAPIVSPERASDHAYFAKIDDQLRNGGHEALLYHLLHEVDIRDFNVRAVPKTAALAEQAAYSRKGVDLLVEIACNSARVPCSYYRSHPDFSPVGGYDDRRGFDYFIDHNVDRHLSGMGALMVKRRLKADWSCVTGHEARRTVGKFQHSGLVWPPLMELRAKFEKKFGKQEWREDETQWKADPEEPL